MGKQSANDSMSVWLIPRDVFFRADLTCVPSFQDLKEESAREDGLCPRTRRGWTPRHCGRQSKARRVTLPFLLLVTVGLPFLCFLYRAPLRSRFTGSCVFLCVDQSRGGCLPHNPDVGTSVTGEQFRAVRAFLQDHKEVHFVWFDFTCLPQPCGRGILQESLVVDQPLVRSRQGPGPPGR